MPLIWCTIVQSLGCLQPLSLSHMQNGREVAWAPPDGGWRLPTASRIGYPNCGQRRSVVAIMAVTRVPSSPSPRAPPRPCRHCDLIPTSSSSSIIVVARLPEFLHGCHGHRRLPPRVPSDPLSSSMAATSSPPPQAPPWSMPLASLSPCDPPNYSCSTSTRRLQNGAVWWGEERESRWFGVHQPLSGFCRRR
jgi:hypothetical protein